MSPPLSNDADRVNTVPQPVRESFGTRFFRLFGGSRVTLDETAYEALEEALILADVGVTATTRIVERLRQRSRRERITDRATLVAALREEIVTLLTPVAQPLPDPLPGSTTVILLVGVNGVGKTTLTARLAREFQRREFTVMLAACDTFRAAAIEQLGIWSNRLDIPMVAQTRGADAAAVAHDAMLSAKAKGINVLLIDSAGRAHVNTDLMQQLQKMVRVMAKVDATAPNETLLVLDAANGQNAIAQCEAFTAEIAVTGLCLTKVDGTARAGIIISLAERFALPISYVGVGEGIDDLMRFDPVNFAVRLVPDAPV